MKWAGLPVAAVLLIARALIAQNRPDVIRGTVTSDSGRAMRNVTVIATMAPDRTVQQAITDSLGKYELQFTNGTGDYLIYSAPVGYRAFRRRVMRPANNAPFVVDIRLAPDAALLTAVNTTAPRPRVTPDFGLSADPTGSEQYTNALLGVLTPE